MERLYGAMRVTEGPVTVDELMRRCTRLERSLTDKYSDLVGRTAVTLLKNQVVCGPGVWMTRRELNARKAVFVALNFVDLTLNAYEPDYDEAYRELKNTSSNTNKKGLNFLGYDSWTPYLTPVIQYSSLFFFFVPILCTTCIMRGWSDWKAENVNRKSIVGMYPSRPLWFCQSVNYW